MSCWSCSSGYFRSWHYLQVLVQGLALSLPGFLPRACRSLPHYDQTTLFWRPRTHSVSKKPQMGSPGGSYYARTTSSPPSWRTHLDAPLHFARSAQRFDQIRSDRSSRVVIDVVPQAVGDADYQISVEDITAAEKAQGPIPANAIVLFRTGFSRRWPDAARYLGTAARGPDAVRDLHFPGLHPDAAKWLVANRTIRAVGIDTASIDYGQSALYQTHGPCSSATSGVQNSRRSNGSRSEARRLWRCR